MATTPERQAEADAASLAFHTALTGIGATSLADALVLWDEVPPGSEGRTASRWLTAALRLVMTRRRLSRDLSLAYYRLVRALHTGTTVADPRKPEPDYVPLSTLRREFAELARQPTADTPAPSQEEGSREPGRTDGEEAERILVEELYQLAAEEDRIARAAEAEARIALEALGPANQQQMVDAIGDKGEASNVDAARNAAHEQAGARQAAAVERLVRDGARSELWSAMQADKKVVGYVRYSTTGTPCGWCAMLISRGPVYKSKASATYGGGAASFEDGDKYHDNCHCEALPVWSDEEYDSSSLFDLNRKYSDLWPTVTRGLSGKSALSAWRRFIRAEQKSQRAQAARSTTNVQEA
jgi:hypothetical protein